MTAALRRSVSSLTIPNYRRYFTGQVISLTGNWMQMVAEVWLVVQLTDSGIAVGVTAALQFVPMLLFGAYGGVIADRRDKRHLLMLTQALMGFPALVLFALSLAGVVAPWMIFVLVLCRGAVNAVDNPARQAFVMELVGPERIVNAVSLNAVLPQAARIVGPALAGIIIAATSVTPCFALNALSFAAMLIALRMMDPSQLQPTPLARRASGQVRAAVAEVRRRPELRIPLIMMIVIGTLCFNFQVLLPLFARFTFHGTATTYALLTSAMAVGSLAGALLSGSRKHATPRLLVVSALLFGVTQLLAAAMPSAETQMLALVPLGAASVTFVAGVNSSLQLGSAGELRGRVMALFSVVFLGSTPIGAPPIGWLAEVAGPRSGLVVGGIAALAAALWAHAAFARAKLDGPFGPPSERVAAPLPAPSVARPAGAKERPLTGAGAGAELGRVAS
ncbi:MAG TPA: MFS transporter [Solirubrobacteraceae bacterium]|nr:MFS transporter [Solirubrobacteraceae bacterium]